MSRPYESERMQKMGGIVDAADVEIIIQNSRALQAQARQNNNAHVYADSGGWPEYKDHFDDEGAGSSAMEVNLVYGVSSAANSAPANKQ
mmetsp:Transcript_12631/g.16242  ORF Transcript_12631/g.16242 Transcript_12631/m.16242 type:complete len:89 (+) Transcript_12631:2028-2294(+)